MGHTSTIADFIATADLGDMPDQARVAARDLIFDCVGVALGGSTEAAGAIAAGLARDEGAKSEAGVFGHGFQSSATLAAWVNGVATHALDFDASYITMGQPMAGLMATVFALAEPTNATGREVLEAFVVGYEVTGKLVKTFATRSDGGAWHATATIGTLGCTAAAARLLHLSPVETRQALGIAGSMASGIVSNFGTMSKPHHAGLAARNGVTAAKLAQRDFTGNDAILEATNGFFAAFAGATPDATQDLDEIGRVWEIERGVRYKAYPCGGLCHAAIDATLTLRREHNLRPDDVSDVDVKVSHHTASRIVFGIPETEVQAKFSMPYVLARALLDGQLAPDTFSDDAIREPAAIALAQKVHMAEDPAFAANPALRSPATVTITHKDGNTVSLHVGAARGGQESPLTADELQQKFRTCAARVLDPTNTDRAVELLMNIEKLPNTRDLSALLMGKP